MQRRSQTGRCTCVRAGAPRRDGLQAELRAQRVTCDQEPTRPDSHGCSERDACEHSNRPKGPVKRGTLGALGGPLGRGESTPGVVGPPPEPSGELEPGGGDDLASLQRGCAAAQLPADFTSRPCNAARCSRPTRCPWSRCHRRQLDRRDRVCRLAAWTVSARSPLRHRSERRVQGAAARTTVRFDVRARSLTCRLRPTAALCARPTGGAPVVSARSPLRHRCWRRLGRRRSSR
jgi:hypothetical protein